MLHWRCRILHCANVHTVIMSSCMTRANFVLNVADWLVLLNQTEPVTEQTLLRIFHIPQLSFQDFLKRKSDDKQGKGSQSFNCQA